MENKLKKGILSVLIIFLLLPLLQQVFVFAKIKPTSGFTVAAPVAVLNLENWWNGEYQEKESAYLNENVGFRPVFLRLNNQLDFSLFNRINSDWIVLGKERCFFYDVDLYDYYGQLIDPDTLAPKKMLMAKAIQDTLARLGKTLVIVHAPSKAYFYRDCVDYDPRFKKKGGSNYAAFKRVGDSLGVNQLDFNAWFVAMRSVRHEVLYPKQGFHWSVFGALLAQDSLERYIERKRNIRMVHPHWNTVVRTNVPRSSDNDVYPLLNMMHIEVTDTFSYPDVVYSESENVVRPRALYVGNSFLLTWLANGMMGHVNSEWSLWWNGQYGSNVKHADDPRYTDINKYDWVNGINNVDCIILLYTSHGLARLGDGFIEAAYAHYFPGNGQSGKAIL